MYAGDVSGGVDYRIWKKTDRKITDPPQKKKEREHKRSGIRKSAPYSNKNEITAVKGKPSQRFFLKFFPIDFKKVICVMSVLFRSGILYLN